jgi:hypothetical protein
MANLPLAKVKTLTTAPEYKLVMTSRRPQLGLLGAAELKKNVIMARRLRDKWRDQATQQRRTTQQRHSARVADGEERSVIKAEVFSAALAALEAQLAKVESGGAGPGRALKKTPNKATRTQKHRLSRALTRESMEAERETLTAPIGRGATPRKIAKEAAKAEATKSPAAPAKKAAKKVTTAPQKAAKKSLDSPLGKLPKKVAKKKTAKAVNETPGVDPKKQLRASAADKKSRLDRSGLNSRVKGHVSARGRRSQGRRDARG